MFEKSFLADNPENVKINVNPCGKKYCYKTDLENGKIYAVEKIFDLKLSSGETVAVICVDKPVKADEIRAFNGDTITINEFEFKKKRANRNR